MSNFRPVILCGGTGKRLWPVSRQSYPKQFSKLLSENETMLEATLRRLQQSGGHYPILISNNDYRFLVAEQVERTLKGSRQIVIEPEGRNTAPAICAAAIELAKTDPEAIMFVSPSDHHIHDEATFQNAVRIAIDRAKEGHVVTFGIVPNRAETGYGYIELEAQHDETTKAVPFKTFVEKPNLDDAQAMLKSGRFLWNSGMFIFQVSTIIDAYKQFAPEIYKIVNRATKNGSADLDFFRLSEEFEVAENISFDHAIMEHLSGEVVPLDCGWNDLGSWETVHLESDKDQDGNAQKGSVTITNCKNSLVRSEAPKVHVVGIGLENTAVIAMGDAVLVANLKNSQDVGDAVAAMRKQGICQADIFPRDSRPWGWFETLTRRQRFRVKSIVVKPNQKLSLQSHVHRAEHWVVVEGTARVTIGKDVKMVTENESVFIPLGEVHRLENPGLMDLHLIEVQTGAYLEEDDIVRYEDDYRRT